MENSKKIIVAKNLKASEKFGNSVIEGAIDITHLISDEVQEHSFEHRGRSYIKVKIIERKEPSQFGKTHYMEIDQFVPKARNKPNSKA